MGELAVVEPWSYSFACRARLMQRGSHWRICMKSTMKKFLGLIALVVAIFGSQAWAQQDAPSMPSEEQMQAMAARASELGLPEGVIQLGPCVPGMGEHWANPAHMPFGPIYGVMGDKLTFVEVMPSQEMFAAGESWLEVLVPIEGYAIDHVDFEFVSHGHEGYEVPHYDIHAYFVTHDEHMGYCPAGESAH